MWSAHAQYNRYMQYTSIYTTHIETCSSNLDFYELHGEASVNRDAEELWHTYSILAKDSYPIVV